MILNHLFVYIIGLAIDRAELAESQLFVGIDLLDTYHALVQKMLFLSNKHHIQICPMKRVNNHLALTNRNLSHLLTSITVNPKIFIQRLIDSL